MRRELGGTLTDLGYALGWRAVRATPPPVADAFFRTGADLAARRAGPGVRQLRGNLLRVLRAEGPAPDSDRLDALVASGMRSYARYWREAFALPAMDPERLYRRMETSLHGRENFDDALDRGRGVIAALTHSGNWDVAGVWLLRELARRGLPVSLTTVAERLRPDSLYRRFVQYREALGFEVLPAGGGARTVATLAGRLREGRVVCLVADRELGSGGVEVEFFGEPAPLPGGPARLARHTGAVLMPFGCWFTSRGWAMRFHPPIEVPPGPTGWAVSSATQTLARAFSEDIAAHPEDWHMLQPVWPADRASSPSLGTSR